MKGKPAEINNTAKELLPNPADTMDDTDPQKATLKLPEQNSLDLLSPEDPLSQPRRSKKVWVDEKRQMRRKLGKILLTEKMLKQPGGERIFNSTSLQSRRHSTVSNASRGSETSEYGHKFGSFSMAQGGALGAEEVADKAQISSNDSAIKRAIPRLPMGASVTCLIMNILVPGFGTIMSGFFAMCFKSSRDAAKDFGMSQFICINVMVGISQILTITFMMVGWFWSLAWGVYLIDESLTLMKENERTNAEEARKKALNMLLGGGENGATANSSSGNALKNLFSRSAS